jgi:hypothetical protein
MEAQPRFVASEALMQMVDAAGGESRTAPNEPVDFVAFLQQQFREVRSVLSGDAGNKCDFDHRN